MSYKIASTLFFYIHIPQRTLFPVFIITWLWSLNDECDTQPQIRQGLSHSQSCMSSHDNKVQVRRVTYSGEHSHFYHESRFARRTPAIVVLFLPHPLSMLYNPLSTNLLPAHSWRLSLVVIISLNTWLHTDLCKYDPFRSKHQLCRSHHVACLFHYFSLAVGRRKYL